MKDVYTLTREGLTGVIPPDQKNYMYLGWHKSGIHLAVVLTKPSHFEAFN